MTFVAGRVGSDDLLASVDRADRATYPTVPPCRHHGLARVGSCQHVQVQTRQISHMLNFIVLSQRFLCEAQHLSVTLFTCMGPQNLKLPRAERESEAGKGSPAQRRSTLRAPLIVEPSVAAHFRLRGLKCSTLFQPCACYIQDSYR